MLLNPFLGSAVALPQDAHQLYRSLTHTLLVPLKRLLPSSSYNPTLKGQAYLQRNAGKLMSTCNRVPMRENFSQLLILELTDDISLVRLPREKKSGTDIRWNFFQGPGQFTTPDFPFDLDTTSLGLTTVKEDENLVMSVMDTMIDYVDENGIVLTYFDHSRPRTDPVVCINVLSLFLTYGRVDQMERSLQWVYTVLLNREYIQGTRYYTTAEAFLFFLSRMLRVCSPRDGILEKFLPLLQERIRERIGADEDPLTLAMRIIVCDYAGVENSVDYKTLVRAQQEDGGWEGILGMYRMGTSGDTIANRGLTTAMAIRAIQVYRASKCAWA
ncbi:hypothetical protein V5O48_010117 [Marasmius crinis-equi]|uniref:Uncharacterized protein n=1 Tax=Marasmius crinis-equi TaxID=585013 RepID=A0ABR3F9T6_9AGAR